MAAGSITTLPALPEGGDGGAFAPGHFKDPKRLYCKNGGFFLRIHPDGRVDGVREKSDPHIKLQLQAEDRGVVSIKGVCANRYLAMKEDGRLLASKCVTDECFFFERLESNNYNTYRSRKYSSWNSKDNSRTSSEDGKNYKCVWRKKESFERGNRGGFI
ncbi:fibroblast growth factor 2 isoform X1 [Cavia porcellus]|uniref:fibroblast growth factor 2 isoform X1 n=1 Tax=Cavia porcellus TaxID=10141 RepID=UPI002FE32847